MDNTDILTDSFAHPKLSSALIDTLAQLGLTRPTDAQRLTLDDALENRDLLVKSRTGSGKTLAFVIPILQKQLNALEQASDSTPSARALILCPTRELVDQVAEELRRVAKVYPNYKVLQLTGGISIGPQLASLKHIPHAIVATPGRLLDIVRKSSLSFQSLQTLVIDEADRMMDMGFAEQMQSIFDIIDASGAKPQHMLFSATMPASLKRMVTPLFRNPSIIEVQPQQQHAMIEQEAWQLTSNNKRTYVVAALLTQYQPLSCIVFCNTKRDVDELHEYLFSNQFDVIALHGDMTQAERDIAIRQFKANCANVLVASDVAARGLDIDNVELVISAQVSVDTDTHVHRIGRTGRADKKGLAVIVHEPMQNNHIDKLAETTRQQIPRRKTQALRFHANRIKHAVFKGVIINAGKKQKINKVDIVGTLTKQGMIPSEDIGKIFVSATSCFIAIKLRSVKPTLKCLRGNKIKGKRVSVRAA